MTMQQPDTTKSEKIKRPYLIWILYIYATFGLSNLVSYYLITSGKLVLDGPAGEYHQTLQLIDHIFNVLTPIYFYFCALQLFRLKAIAFKLFVGYIVIMGIFLAHNSLSSSWRMLIESEPLGYYSTMIDFVLYCAYAYYSSLLIKKNILK